MSELFPSDFDLYDQFEGFSPGLLFAGTTCMIPAINTTLMPEHPLFVMNKSQNLECAYVVIEGLKSMVIEWGDYSRTNSHKMAFSTGIEGSTTYEEFNFSHVFQDTGFYLYVHAQAYRIWVPASARLSSEMWIPKNTPSFPPNMEKERTLHLISLWKQHLEEILGFKYEVSQVLDFAI